LLKELHFDRGVEMEKALMENSSRLMNIMHGHRSLIRIVVLDLPRVEGTAQGDPIASTFTGPLSGYLASQAETGKLRNIDTEVAADVLYGILRSFYLDTYLFKDKVPEPSHDLRFIKSAVSIYLDGVCRGRDGSPPMPGRKRTK
jgi:hypothetical protein